MATHVFCSLSDFVHVFAILSVSFLIFGSRENILHVFYNTSNDSMLQNPVRTFIERILQQDTEEILKFLSNSAESRISPKFSKLYGNKGGSHRDSKEIKKEIDNQKDRFIDKLNIHLKVQTKKIYREYNIQSNDTIYKRTNPNQDATYKSINSLEKKIAKTKFTSASLFCGLNSFLMLLISSWCHTYCHEGKNMHIWILISSFNICLVSYFVLLSIKDANDKGYSNRISAIKIFVLCSISCLIPFVLLNSLQFYSYLFFIIILVPLGFLLYGCNRKWYFRLAVLILLLQLFILPALSIGSVNYFSFFTVLDFTTNHSWSNYLLALSILILIGLLVFPWFYIFYFLWKLNVDIYDGLLSKESIIISAAKTNTYIDLRS